MTSEQKKISQRNRRSAVKHFKTTGEWFEGCVLHHINPEWRHNDIERYIQWNIEDLVVMDYGEHTALHNKDRVGKHFKHKDNSNYLGNSNAKRRPVVCIETNKIFESAADAARFYNISNNIRHAIQHKKTCGGYHWDYI